MLATGESVVQSLRPKLSRITEPVTGDAVYRYVVTKNYCVEVEIKRFSERKCELFPRLLVLLCDSRNALTRF